MLPSSQQVLMEPPQSLPEGGALLAGAFSEFIEASARLELSYRELQAQVAELSQALGEQNRALMDSRSENRAMADRLQHILETIPCGVLVVADDGAVRLANPEAARLLALATGYLAPELGETVAVPGLQLALQGDEREDEQAEQELLFEGLEGRVWIAVRRVSLPCTVSLAASRAEAVLTLRDISARKRMEEERESARGAVALAQISALLAHEIRNPLASLELFAGLLEDDGDRRGEWLGHLRAGIRTLSGTVNNVLTLHGGPTLPAEVFHVELEAALAVEFLQPLAKQQEVRLRLRLEEGSAPEGTMRAWGNRHAFHQVLMNLCTNALRHTPAGGEVTVTCGVWSAARLRVNVVDTGCGIPEAQLPRIFEIGFSGTGATSGLGLAVCEQLVRQMRGEIRVESCVGLGSAFTLEIPRAC